MTLNELWQLFPVILTAPNPAWPAWASEEMTLLESVVGASVVSIHHIGSTAIKGIWAKPIIDILLETGDVSKLPEIKATLINSGYICMKESDTRLDFNKGYTPAGFAERVFHIHVRIEGDNDEIAFRNFLNKNPEIAKKYELLKLSLWKPFEHNRDGYTAAKSEFVKYYTTLAKSAKHP